LRHLSARQLWRDAFQVLPSQGVEFMDPKTSRNKRRGPVSHATETRTKRGNDMQILNSVEMGQVQNVVSRLPTLHQSWGAYAYTDIFTTEDHDRVRQWLFGSWAEEHGEEYQGSFTKTGRIIILVDLACEDMKTRNTTGQTTQRDEMHKSLGIRKNNLRRDGWLSRLDSMEFMLDEIDQEALAPLGALLGH